MYEVSVGKCVGVWGEVWGVWGRVSRDVGV